MAHTTGGSDCARAGYPQQHPCVGKQRQDSRQGQRELCRECAFPFVAVWSVFVDVAAFAVNCARSRGVALSWGEKCG